MSRDTRQTDITSERAENDEAVQEALEADHAYQSYLEEMYEKTAASDNTTETDDQEGAQHVSHRTGRVVNVSFNDWKNEVRLKVERNDGTTFDEQFDAVAPDETGSEWVRLCHYQNVAPSKPSQMYGEVVPIRSDPSDVARGENPSSSVDVPPVMGGLNPLAYKIKRALYNVDIRFSQESAFSDKVLKPSEFLVAGPIGVLLTAVGGGLGMLGSMLGSTVLSTFGVLAFPLAMVYAVVLAVTLALGISLLLVSGLLLLSLLSSAIIHLHEQRRGVLARIKERLFPSE